MIYFCFRDTHNWDGKDSFKKSVDIFFSIGRKGSQLIHKKYLNFWNETQPVNFFEYRKELKKITKLTFSDADVPEINVENWRDLSDDDWLIPIDDDDWFCPNFKKHINSTNENFVYGNFLIFDATEIKFKFELRNKNPVLQKKHKLVSCGYAVKAGVLKQLSNHDSNKLIKRHAAVSNIIVRNNISYKFIPESMSCWLMHPGCTTHMWWQKNLNKFMKEKLIFYDNNPPKNVPKEAQWCNKYLEKFMEIVNQFHIPDIKIL